MGQHKILVLFQLSGLLLSKEVPILKIRKLSLGYDSDAGVVIAIDNLSLDIPKGKISSIVGESGSGKSTLANAIMGFVKYPNVRLSGSIYFHDEDILTMGTVQLRRMRMEKISVVPQAAMNSLNPVMKIGDEIHDIISAHKKMSPEEEKKIVSSALEMVELPDYVLNSYQNQISGGMRQRVMIAIASMLDPEIMILDEPTTGLDVIVQKNILDIIKKINKNKGTTVVLITHDIPVAFYLSDFASIIYAGKVVEDGRKESIFTNRLHPYTNLLIGSIPSMTGSSERLTTIPGEVKPLMENQKLCSFIDRCPFAIAECRSNELEDYEEKDEMVRCHRYNPSLKDNFTKQKTEDKGKSESGFSSNITSRFAVVEDHSIELIDLNKNYTVGRGSKAHVINALKGVNIKVETGKVVSLVGASGSGKTTVGKIILFDERATSGKYIIDGRDVTHAKDREVKRLRRTVQMIFQDPFSSLSPIHKIGYQIKRPLLINHMSEANDVKDNILGMLNLVGLRPAESFFDKFPHELSGGQRQRVSIAKALSVGARILVADEPVSMLDASVRAEILNLLSDLKNRLKIGILYITHDLSTVRYVADHIYVMNAGMVEEEGNWVQIANNPSKEYTKKLLDSVV
ncbi:putative ABC transporter ATP-binding protein [Thermoplasmatales archaeon]|nr:putative ABC transporter ATP-binding protein [Thermoplasmatales archaeon]